MSEVFDFIVCDNYCDGCNYRIRCEEEIKMMPTGIFEEDEE